VPPALRTDTAADVAERRADDSDAPVHPVFVDASGRRQRLVRRVGRLLVVPAAGYVALLLSSVFGGPSISSPYLPLPKAADHRPVGSRPDTSASPGGTRRPATIGAGGRSTGFPSPRSSPAAATAAAASILTPAPGLSPSPAPTTAGPVTAAPTPVVTHGKSTATHPVPTHTGRGHS
jgi:hypothetical protein